MELMREGERNRERTEKGQCARENKRERAREEESDWERKRERGGMMSEGEKEKERGKEREEEREGSDVSFPLFEIFNECLCSPEILTFSHIARGDSGERRLFPRSNKKQKAVSIKLSSVSFIYLFFVFFFDLSD